LVRFGVPEEVITDNGRQFTDRFGRRGEVLFDKICRKNGITHRLTEPNSPNQNGKVERFHGTFRPELLDVVEPFETVQAAQAEVDRWVGDYNIDRPHQALHDSQPVTPDERFEPVAAEQRALVELWLPPALEAVAKPHEPDSATVGDAAQAIPPLLPAPWAGGAVEFDRIIPPSGNLAVAGRQFWLGPARAGLTVTFWADTDLIHLLIGGARVKTVRSHLSVNDLAALAAMGGRLAGPPPLPPPEKSTAVEVDRTVARNGIVSLGGRQVLAADILGGRRVSIRIERQTLQFFDPDSRQLLRTRPNPLSSDQARRLRGARPAGPPPRPSIEPIRVQRRASATGVIMVAGQKIALGRIHAGKTVTVRASDTALTVDAGDGEVRVFRRTTDQPVRSIKGQRPRTATSVS
ncbi:MAG: integrase core domain-containing protein, partial [Actinomycetes bacterium]